MSGSANTVPEPPLGARDGVVGGLAKRVVERLIRFYTYRQDTVNRDVDERLRELEELPVARPEGVLQVRAQVSALSARVTHLQREVAQLRDRLERLEKTRE